MRGVLARGVRAVCTVAQCRKLSRERAHFRHAWQNCFDADHSVWPLDGPSIGRVGVVERPTRALPIGVTGGALFPMLTLCLQCRSLVALPFDHTVKTCPKCLGVLQAYEYPDQRRRNGREIFLTEKGFRATDHVVRRTA